MKNIAIYYFSGTGNTKKVVKAYQEAFEAKGEKVEVATVQQVMQLAKYRKSELYYKYDLRVLAFPVHAFSAPEPIQELIRALAKVTSNKGDSGVRYVIVTTSGEPLSLNDAAAAKVAQQLNKKGYVVQAAYRYVMPYNLIFRHSDAYAEAMVSTMRALVKIDAENTYSNALNLPRVGGVKRFIAMLLSVEHRAMHWIGKRFTTDGNCNACGKCAERCPLQNITMVNKKPTFGAKCVGCMCCSFGCAKQAIHIGILNRWRVCGDYPDPLNDKTHSLNHKTHSTNDKTHSTNDKTDSVNGETDSVNGETNLVNDKLYLANEEIYSVSDKTHSVNETTYLVNGNANLANDKTSSANEETHSVNDKLYLANEEIYSVSDKTHSVNETTYLVNGNANLANDKTDSVNGETYLVNDKLYLANEEIYSVSDKIHLINDKAHSIIGDVSEQPRYRNFMRRKYERYFQKAEKKIAEHTAILENADKTE